MIGLQPGDQPSRSGIGLAVARRRTPTEWPAAGRQGPPPPGVRSATRWPLAAAASAGRAPGPGPPLFEDMTGRSCAICPAAGWALADRSAVRHIHAMGGIKAASLIGRPVRGLQANGDEHRRLTDACVSACAPSPTRLRPGHRAAGLRRGIELRGGLVQVALLTDRAHAAAMEPVRRAAEALLARQPGVTNATAVLTAHKAPRATAAAARRPRSWPRATGRSRRCCCRT